MYDLLEKQEVEEVTRPLSTAEVVESVGVTYRQIMYWVNSGHLSPEGANTGSGHSLKWDQDDVEKVTLLKKLIDLGITLKTAKRLCQSKYAREKFINELTTL